MDKPAHVDPYVVPEGTVVILKGRHEYSIIDIRNKLARRGLEIRNNVVVRKAPITQRQ